MPPRKKAQIAFASAVTLLALSEVTAYVSIVRLLESEELVIHSLRVQSALGDFTNAIARVGRVATAYVATGREEFLGDFQPYLDEVPPTMEHLRDLTKDNPSQECRSAYANLPGSLKSAQIQLEQRFESQYRCRLRQWPPTPARRTESTRT